MTALHYYTLDVFTNTRFQGNPLAVVGDAADLSDAQMQSIAAEFNLSETVFLCPPSATEAMARLRIFTPKAELPFAGHPSIGTALLLAHLSDQGLTEVPQDIVLECQAGLIKISYQIIEGQLWARLVAPLQPRVLSTLDREALASHLQISAQDLQAPLLCASGPQFIIAQTSMQALQAMKSPPSSFAAAPQALFYLFARNDPQGALNAPALEIEARCFAPHLGINEDAATGGAAVALAAYLTQQNKTSITDRDAQDQHVMISQGRFMQRPSCLRLQYQARGANVTQALLAGQAVMISEGDLLLD